MSSPTCPSRTSLLDIDILEEDPVPTFVIKVGTHANPFEMLFCNASFRKSDFRDTILATTRPARLFRVWCEALSFQRMHNFDGRVWAAEVVGREGNWKVVRAAESVLSGHTLDDYYRWGSNAMSAKSCCGSASFPLPNRPNLNAIRSTSFPISLHSSESDLPPDTIRRISPSPPARRPMSISMDIVSSMLDMMDVGVFEIDPTGKLQYANDAWFRLSGHAKDAHEDFAFMDLVHPEDEAFVMSQWNTLIQGRPVSFEMRWKPHENTPEPAQWVLASSCPVIGESGETLSISGITIDINGQKKSEEAVAARLEALELAKLSERKFARFATLSPIAIYIKGPDKGLIRIHILHSRLTQCAETGLINFQYVNDMFFELTGHPRVPFEQISWEQIVVAEDVKKAKDACFTTTGDGHMTEPVQLKLKKTWTNQKGACSEVWVQGSSYPELDENGSVISERPVLLLPRNCADSC
jgi:PAS domain S-box-containing protein